MKIGIRAHDFGCLPPVRLAEKMAAQGVEAAQLAIPKAIAGVESYAQVTDGLLREIGAAFREHHIDIAVLGCYIEPSLPDEAARKAQLDTARASLAVSTLVTASWGRIVRLVNISALRLRLPSSSSTSREHSRQ